jgi:hypothetical protein
MSQPAAVVVGLLAVAAVAILASSFLEEGVRFHHTKILIHHPGIKQLMDGFGAIRQPHPHTTIDQFRQQQYRPDGARLKDFDIIQMQFDAHGNVLLQEQFAVMQQFASSSEIQIACQRDLDQVTVFT